MFDAVTLTSSHTMWDQRWRRCLKELIAAHETLFGKCYSKPDTIRPKGDQISGELRHSLKYLTYCKESCHNAVSFKKYCHIRRKFDYYSQRLSYPNAFKLDILGVLKITKALVKITRGTYTSYTFNVTLFFIIIMPNNLILLVFFCFKHILRLVLLWIVRLPNQCLFTAGEMCSEIIRNFFLGL